MQITKLWLKERGACSSGMEFVEEKQLLGLEGTEFVRKLMEYEQYEYANWLIARIMDYKQCVKYARFSADLAKKYAEKTERAAEMAEMAAMAARAKNAAYKEILTYGLQLLEENICKVQ